MLVFIHINKTAGRTVRYMLRSTFGPHHCEAEPWQTLPKDKPFSNNDLQRLRKLYPHLESIAGHRITGHVDLQANGSELQYFTFMRDPLKTCASRFQYNVQYRGKKDLVFEEWIQLEWPRNSQTKMIAGVADVDEAIRMIRAKEIFVGLTERFDESMLLFKALIAEQLNISYQRVNEARNNTIAQSLLANERTRQMLIEANQADLKLYHFVTQELYPARQREYGPSLAEDVAHYQQGRNHSFNYRNLTLSRLKQYVLYKPLLYLHRKGVKVV
ncbi:MAG: sulfotransferase family 2 domain-containing protein [Caldilineaceae bacterium]|nr:sulfotransferase family 2 domain-containing protein [Caldilineaceae bacterium]